MVMWCWGSSLALPSSFGMFEESLWGMGGHQGECMIGSLVNHDRSGKYNVARKDNG